MTAGIRYEPEAPASGFRPGTIPSLVHASSSYEASATQPFSLVGCSASTEFGEVRHIGARRAPYKELPRRSPSGTPWAVSAVRAPQPDRALPAHRIRPGSQALSSSGCAGYHEESHDNEPLPAFSPGSCSSHVTITMFPVPSCVDDGRGVRDGVGRFSVVGPDRSDPGQGWREDLFQDQRARGLTGLPARRQQSSRYPDRSGRTASGYEDRQCDRQWPEHGLGSQVR